METNVKMASTVIEASLTRLLCNMYGISIYDTEVYLAYNEKKTILILSHENYFLWVVSTRKKYSSPELIYIYIYPGANNPEEFLLYNVRIVPWVE